MTSLRPTTRHARQLAARAGTPEFALGATAAAAAVGFGTLARATARRETAAIDEAVRETTAPAPDSRVRRIAHGLAPLGRWYTYIPAALGLAAYTMNARHVAFRRPRGRDRKAGSVAIVAAGALAYGLAKASDKWLPQPPAPPGHEDREKPVFPSGHAMGTAAVSLTAAYVMARQGRARPQVALPLAAVLPLAFAGPRLVDERHWASDILGGYLGALTVAGACLAGYELTREGSGRKRKNRKRKARAERERSRREEDGDPYAREALAIRRRDVLDRRRV